MRCTLWLLKEDRRMREDKRKRMNAWIVIVYEIKLKWIPSSISCSHSYEHEKHVKIAWFFGLLYSFTVSGGISGNPSADRGWRWINTIFPISFTAIVGAFSIVVAIHIGEWNSKRFFISQVFFVSTAAALVLVVLAKFHLMAKTRHVTLSLCATPWWMAFMRWAAHTNSFLFSVSIQFQIEKK